MTNIEWTDTTDNIITVESGGWWCRKISAGCLNCYAANLNLMASNPLPQFPPYKKGGDISEFPVEVQIREFPDYA